MVSAASPSCAPVPDDSTAGSTDKAASESAVGRVAPDGKYELVRRLWESEAVHEARHVAIGRRVELAEQRALAAPASSVGRSAALRFERESSREPRGRSAKARFLGAGYDPLSESLLVHPRIPRAPATPKVWSEYGLDSDAAPATRRARTATRRLRRGAVRGAASAAGVGLTVGLALAWALGLL
jgi:hypothetical protein